MSFFGGKNSFWRKPLGTGTGSVAQLIGAESPDIEKGGLSGADKKREEFLAAQMEDQIKGEGSSLAVDQYKKAQDDATNQAMSLASSTKGVSNPALLARNVAAASDNQAQELAQDSAIMRGQEKRDAMGMMNQYLAAKQGIAMQNAQMQNQANQAVGDRQAAMIGAAGGAMATAAASDEKLKKNVSKSKGDANKKVSEFIDALDSYNFEYKDEKFGQGEKTGIMAQDLEKSELGKQMVKDTPEGKMVDFGQGFAAILAAQAELKDELDSMKSKKA